MDQKETLLEKAHRLSPDDESSEASLDKTEEKENEEEKVDSKKKSTPEFTVESIKKWQEKIKSTVHLEKMKANSQKDRLLKRLFKEKT